jgi:hypothetical protein
MSTLQEILQLPLFTDSLVPSEVIIGIDVRADEGGEGLGHRPQKQKSGCWQPKESRFHD